MFSVLVSGFEGALGEIKSRELGVRGIILQDC
jgi:hypothetical protein